MAVYLCDLDLTTGTDTGTVAAGWANAFKTMASAFPRSAWDIVYIRGTELANAATTVDFGGSSGNPVIVIGVPTGGSPSEPPTQAQIIQGIRTGGATTGAKDANIPVLGTLTSNQDLAIDGYAYFYGIKFFPYRQAFYSTEHHYFHFDECYFESTQHTDYGFTLGSANTVMGYGGHNRLTNCVFDPSLGKLAFAPGTEIINSETAMAAKTDGVIRSARGIRHIGCDYSNAAHTLVKLATTSPASADADPMIFDRCQLHASSALTTGTAVADYRLVLNQCKRGAASETTRQEEYEVYSFRGDIIQDTVNHLTTGAANDGLNDYSLAYTLTVANVLENYVPMYGEWMVVDVDGDGTSKTLTVLINNSGASDLTDQEVWLEAAPCSATGTAKADWHTGQMQLLGTPSSSNSFISNDTTAWDGSLTQAQKLTIAIAPDYDGPLYCRVLYAKTGTPPTLYVNPEPTVA